MATAIYKVNYQGLRKRESYDEIVDYLENKQERIKYPNRLAKQLRNSPQLSNLLDNGGEGLVEMEEQQQRKMQHEQAEQAVRQAASNGGTAQVLRAAGQNDNTDIGEDFQDAVSVGEDYDDKFSDFQEAMSFVSESIASRIEQKADDNKTMFSNELDGTKPADKIADTLASQKLRVKKGLPSKDLKSKGVKKLIDKENKGFDDKPKLKLIEKAQAKITKTKTGKASTDPPSSSSSFNGQQPASSSTAIAIAPPPAKTPRARATTRPGTRTETNDPENIPRAIAPPPAKTPGASSKAKSKPTQPQAVQVGARSKTASPPAKATAAQLTTKGSSELEQEREQFNISNLKGKQLQNELKRMNLSTSGTKEEKHQRLRVAYGLSS